MSPPRQSLPPRKSQDVDALIAQIQEHLPRFEVLYKDESVLQRWIGRLLWPINRTYMTEYTTVMFGKVYFPSREIVASWGAASVYRILRHEFVHLIDAKRFPLYFELSYLLCLPCFFTMRAYWEFRGYTQDMLVEYEETGDVSTQTLDFIEARFVSAEYGWMLWPRSLVRRHLYTLRTRVLAGELRGPYPYQPWGQS